VTLRPVDNLDEVRGVEGDRYPLPERCAAPNCTSGYVERHHLVRKSSLRKQPFEWIKLPSGVVMGNSVPLCPNHHRMVTDNEWWLRIETTKVRPSVIWCAVQYDLANKTSPLPVEPITWQPPVNFGDGFSSLIEKEQEEKCPTCGKPKHAKRSELPPGEKRKRASWVVTVPDDERENGADVLDSLAEGVMEAFGRGAHTSTIARYFACVEAFAFVIQNKDMIAREREEAEHGSR
jgi:hypothetical protein